MRYRAIACLLVCMTFGVSAYGQSRSQIDAAYPRITARPNSLDKLTIRFVNRGCGWFCPVYSIEINGDGTVTYAGGSFARIKGVRRWHISQNKVLELIDKFYSSHYFTLLPQYGTCGDDGAEFEFSIEWPGVIKHVVDCSSTLLYRINRDELSPTEGMKKETEYLAELKIFIENTANVQSRGEINLRNSIVPSPVDNPFAPFSDYTIRVKLNFEDTVPVEQY